MTERGLLFTDMLQ